MRSPFTPLFYQYTTCHGRISPQSRTAASETVSIVAASGIGASVLGAILSREGGTSVVVSSKKMDQKPRLHLRLEGPYRATMMLHYLALVSCMIFYA